MTRLATERHASAGALVDRQNAADALASLPLVAGPGVSSRDLLLVLEEAGDGDAAGDEDDAGGGDGDDVGDVEVEGAGRGQVAAAALVVGRRAAAAAVAGVVGDRRRQRGRRVHRASRTQPSHSIIS